MAINKEFVAIDLETTGKYPLNAEICELSLIKFNQEQTLETYSTLIKPKFGMNKEAENIHGLSLKDLESSPSIEDVLEKVADFVDGRSLVGHNIPFDLGFLIYEVEKNSPHSLQAFQAPHFCTSLLSLELYPKLTSHRLLYLCNHFDIEVSPNHRAQTDAEACKDVFNKLTASLSSIADLKKAQSILLNYEDFSVEALKKNRPEFKPMIEACEKRQIFELVYMKGSKKNQWRSLKPQGLVLKHNDLGFLVAQEGHKEIQQSKRFLLKKIKESR